MDKEYLLTEIVQEGLIKAPSGTTNPLSVYQYILRMIKEGKLDAGVYDKTAFGNGVYKVTKSSIDKFNANRKSKNL